MSVVEDAGVSTIGRYNDKRGTTTQLNDIREAVIDVGCAGRLAKGAPCAKPRLSHKQPQPDGQIGTSRRRQHEICVT